jgi:hypothetical protein
MLTKSSPLRPARASWHNTGQGLGTQRRGPIDGNARPQALWLFSVDACGAYGFNDLKVLHAARTEPVGQITLTSDERL